jgi:formylglycine-generating enzyme required for sulfatase activity
MALFGKVSAPLPPPAGETSKTQINNKVNTVNQHKATYYLSFNYQESGPFRMEHLETMAKTGQITRNYFIRVENTAEWAPITTISELVSILPRIAPVPPPPRPQPQPAPLPPRPQPAQKSAPDPNIVAAYIRQGDSYYNQKHYDRAIAEYTRAILLDPNSSVAYRNCGAAYSSKGDYNQALAKLSQAILIAPDAMTYTSRGHIYSTWHDDKKALADYTEAIRLSPNLSAPYTARGLIYEKIAKNSLAIADYKQALSLNPTDTAAKAQLGKLQHKSHIFWAITIIIVIVIVGSQFGSNFSTSSTATSSGIEQSLLAAIPSGTFAMGSLGTEVNREPNELQHQVTVNGFYMGKYEVTQKEYQALMGTNPSAFKGDYLPVENVTWYDAVDYCNARSWSEGLTPAYTVSGTNVTWDQSANGYRLPTEAEWEYACRARTMTPFSTGSNITTDQANYDGNYPYNGNANGTYREKTTAVGSFAVAWWGLYDMHGNVSEWCWDWYNSDYGTAARIDPTGASTGSIRVFRGGSWFRAGRYLRSASRGVFYTPSDRYSDLGFRLVRSRL